MSKNQSAPTWLLLSTVFVVGNIIMMLEVAGTRLVSPYFGTGLYVWSAIITVTLLSLSIGYWWGGRLADRYQQSKILYFGLLLAALGIVIVPWLRVPVLSAVGPLGLRYGVLLGSRILFVIPLI